MGVLILPVIGLPILVGVLMATGAGWVRPSLAHRVTVAVIGLAMLSTLVLLCCAGEETVFTLTWLPDVGSMGVGTAASGLWVALVTIGAVFLISIDPASRMTPLSGAVTLLALGAAGVALLTDHFLARYVALEVVALCVALAPLVEVGGEPGTSLAWSCYLLLRVGDAGLLSAILLLNRAAGTLRITPALNAGGALNGELLGWVVFGFLLAVWVKLGGWPFHLWSQVGQRLSLVSQGWLYAILVPNLGAYLLYRVVPLLALAGPLQTAALWCGGVGAVLSALVALMQADPRDALVHLGAAQGGLMLFAAAAGAKSVVWLGLLVLTPVRLLLFMAADVVRRADAARRPGKAVRRWAGACIGLGGLALAAFGLLTVWWGRGANPDAGVSSLPAVFIAGVAAGLVAVWAVHAVWQLSRPLAGFGDVVGRRDASTWVRWGVVGLLGGFVLVGGLAFEPLARYLTDAVHVALPSLPAFLALLHDTVTFLALVVGIVVGLVLWGLRGRVRWTFAQDPARSARGLETGLTRVAQAVGNIVELGVLGRRITLVVRVVLGISRAAQVVELGVLERSIDLVVRAVAGVSRAVRTVEFRQEDLLSRGVQGVQAYGQLLRRWHTGRLRRNLLWVPVVLVLAVLVTVVLGW